MGRGFSILALIVGGIIVADIIAHGQSTYAASQGVRQVEVPAFNALLGVPS